jgi:prepilin-type N-terminal cleavage/methylation domain-containing protein
MMRFRNQKGFTLLEIMLVVLIIGIIALLALPRLLVTRKMAQAHTCLGDQSAIRTHLEAYKWLYGFYPQTGTEWTAFLNDPEFWPVGDPAPKYCPAGTAYPWNYTTSGVAVTNEHGTGYPEYNLECSNTLADPPHYEAPGM